MEVPLTVIRLYLFAKHPAGVFLITTLVTYLLFNMAFHITALDSAIAAVIVAVGVTYRYYLRFPPHPEQYEGVEL